MRGGSRAVGIGWVLTGFLLAAPVSQTAACNLHELSHAGVGTLLGWEVERVNLCLFGGGSVDYASSSASGDNIESLSGGLAAALFLAVAWWLLVGRRPDRHHPAWWGVGLGIALGIGPQLVIAVLETAVPVGESYVDWANDQPEVFAGILAVSVLSSVGGHTWLWRRSRRHASDGQAH
jgi:hypothetical protein